MGSWGDKPFDNDDALDWLSGFEGEGVDGLRGLLSKVAATPEDEYMDVDDGNAAVAAAEIVAVALHDRRDDLPPEARRWLDANPGAIRTHDRELARRAMERVLGPHSELVGLWDDYGHETEWHAGMRGLMARLGGDPDAASLEARAARRKAIGPAKARELPELDEGALEQMKDLLLTVLDTQGLHPTAAQLSRIRASRDAMEVSVWLGRAGNVASVDELLKGPTPPKSS